MVTYLPGSVKAAGTQEQPAGPRTRGEFHASPPGGIRRALAEDVAPHLSCRREPAPAARQRPEQHGTPGPHARRGMAEPVHVLEWGSGLEHHDAGVRPAVLPGSE